MNYNVAVTQSEYDFIIDEIHKVGYLSRPSGCGTSKWMVHNTNGVLVLVVDGI